MAVLLLRGTDIDGNETVCTGPQIALILDIMLSAPELTTCDWYAGAIDHYGPAIEPYQEQKPRRVDYPRQFVDTIRSGNQLLDGIIFAVRAGGQPVLRSTVFTADGPMEKCVANCAVEVHAFDTSWVEIFSDDLPLMKRLADQFRGGRWYD